jgi:hypothetical protein
MNFKSSILSQKFVKLFVMFFAVISALRLTSGYTPAGIQILLEFLGLIISPTYAQDMAAFRRSMTQARIAKKDNGARRRR